MKVSFEQTTKYKILTYINGLQSHVVLRRDINTLDSPRQITRALNQLVSEAILIRLGYGVYAKASKSQYSDAPILQAPFAVACVEALDKLKIKWELGDAITAYNTGKTQQVPAQFVVRLKSRFRGHLAEGKRAILFEGQINAR